MQIVVFSVNKLSLVLKVMKNPERLLTIRHFFDGITFFTTVHANAILLIMNLNEGFFDILITSHVEQH